MTEELKTGAEEAQQHTIPRFYFYRCSCGRYYLITQRCPYHEVVDY